MKFPSAERILMLHELETDFRNMVISINASNRWNNEPRESGRAFGFWGAANLVEDKIKHLDRVLDRRAK